MAIWYISWTFGTFYGYFVYFSRFGMLYQGKSGNPGRHLNSYSAHGDKEGVLAQAGGT
jgi:hypothetical protein